MKCENCNCTHLPRTFSHCPFCGWRLEGMQGPERHLVGDVAERIPQQGDVEAAKPGRRGVGEIAGANELLGIIDRQIEKVRLANEVAISKDWVLSKFHNEAQIAALSELRKIVAATSGERSDLSNR